ncbi:MAG: hypothetical protein WCY09_10465 [Candidatus Omnitrophota bacterium]|jgi:hypothetical protein
MNIKELIALLPEANRADAEKAISEAVVAANPVAGIDSNEKAAAYIQGNKFFKGALDSEISVKIASHDEKFMADKFPKLLDAKVKELTGPETDPIKIELAQIKAERAAEKAEAIKDKQLALAAKLAASEGIPVHKLEKWITDNDDATTAEIKEYAKIIKDFRDAAIEVDRKGRFGNNGEPRGGNITPPADLESRYKEALRDPKRADEALILHEQIEAQARLAARNA